MPECAIPTGFRLRAGLGLNIWYVFGGYFGDIWFFLKKKKKKNILAIQRGWERWSREAFRSIWVGSVELVTREAFGSAGHTGFWECWSRGKLLGALVAWAFGSAGRAGSWSRGLLGALVARAFGNAGRAGFWERWSRGKLFGALVARAFGAGRVGSWSRGLSGALVAREAFRSAGRAGFWECWSRGLLGALVAWEAFGSVGGGREHCIFAACIKNNNGAFGQAFVNQLSLPVASKKEEGAGCISIN